MSCEFVEYIDVIRCMIKENITNSNNVFLGHKVERNQIYDLVEKTVEYGESNSALLIGPRGTGKTTLIRNVLQNLFSHEIVQENSILVELHGLVHVDDKLALKSITTQMHLDNAVDGKVFGSFAENLTFLLACLRSGQKETSKSVIFILEEFDLFCNHHNQTLLYNLFDVCQSAQAPICVIGITCRLDVIELLEKRVKSRFSHRQIFLFSSDSFEVYINYVKYLLSINTKNKRLNGSIKKEWQEEIDKLFDDKKFVAILDRIWNIDSNKHTIANILFSVVCKLNRSAARLKLEDFQDELNKFEEDDMVIILRDFNILELCLVIAMKHHCEIYDNQPLNFEMIYTRFLKFANVNSSIQLVQRPVVMKAFEHIQNLEIIAPVSGTVKNLQREYQMFKLMVNKSQIMVAIGSMHGLPTEVLQWANSSLL